MSIYLFYLKKYFVILFVQTLFERKTEKISTWNNDTELFPEKKNILQENLRSQMFDKKFFILQKVQSMVK